MTNPTRLFYGPDGKGADKRPATLYNSRGIRALNISSAGFQGYTANRQSAWFKLILTGDVMRLPGIAKWLEQCEKILYTEFNASSFYESLGELNPDAHAIGTGIIYTEEDIGRKKMVYQCRHPLACWIAENTFGEVDTVHEDVYMTYKEAGERFTDTLPDEKKELVKKTPFERVTIRHAVFPATKEWRARANTDPRMPFVSVWFDKDTHKILDVGGYWEFPFVVSRYAKNPGEVYGRSPGIDALGDILGANQMTKSRLRLAQLTADPTLVVPEELEGDDTVIPGGRIYVPRNTPRIESVQVGANYPITSDTEQRQDQIINDHFNVNIYLMLQQAQGQMTAREVIERTGEKAAILGYVTGRYTTEVLQPLIKRTFNLLMRAGKLPPPPESIKQAKEPTGLDIEFLGFMAQAQKKYFSASGVNAGIEYIGVIGQMFPETLDNIDSDELMKSALESGGVPAAITREASLVKQIRQMKQQAMQQQQAAMQDQAIMQNMDKLNQPVAAGSPLEALGKQAQQAAKK